MALSTDERIALVATLAAIHHAGEIAAGHSIDAFARGRSMGLAIATLKRAEHVVHEDQEMSHNVAERVRHQTLDSLRM